MNSDDTWQINVLQFCGMTSVCREASMSVLLSPTTILRGFDVAYPFVSDAHLQSVLDQSAACVRDNRYRDACHLCASLIAMCTRLAPEEPSTMSATVYECSDRLFYLPLNRNRKLDMWRTIAKVNRSYCHANLNEFCKALEDLDESFRNWRIFFADYMVTDLYLRRAQVCNDMAMHDRALDDVQAIADHFPSWFQKSVFDEAIRASVGKRDFACARRLVNNRLVSSWLTRWEFHLRLESAVPEGVSRQYSMMDIIGVPVVFAWIRLRPCAGVTRLSFALWFRLLKSRSRERKSLQVIAADGECAKFIRTYASKRLEKLDRWEDPATPDRQQTSVSQGGDLDRFRRSTDFRYLETMAMLGENMASVLAVAKKQLKTHERFGLLDEVAQDSKEPGDQILKQQVLDAIELGELDFADELLDRISDQNWAMQVRGRYETNAAI